MTRREDSTLPSSSEGGSRPFDAAEGGSTYPLADATRVSGGPNVVSLVVEGTLSPGGSVSVVALVGDPDGVADIIGGELLEGATGMRLGAFRSEGAGMFTATVTFDALNRIGAIDAPSAGTSRVVRAQFVDNASQRGARDVTVPIRCSVESQTMCGGVCVDLTSNPSHCGACRTSTPSPRICIDGRPACRVGLTFCSTSNTCVDLTRDANNCGACGRSVVPNVCVGGGLACAQSGYTDCAGVGCVNLQSNPSHCGACGNMLPSTARCTGGRGVCNSGNLTYCRTVNTCIDTRTDILNCGACDRPVTAPYSRCQNGAPACDFDRTFCSGTSTCSQLRELENCGTCGRRCPRNSRDSEAAACTTGTCEYLYRVNLNQTCDSKCRSLGGGCTRAIAFDGSPLSCTGTNSHPLNLQNLCYCNV